VDTRISLDEAQHIDWQLFLDLAIRNESTQPCKPVEEVPLLQPQDEHGWRAFRTLTTSAIRKVADNKGGFLVDIPSSTRLKILWKET